MPFAKVLDGPHLRYQWQGSTALDGTWRFVLFSTRRGTLYVRIDQLPWTYYEANGSVAGAETAEYVRGRPLAADRLIRESIDATVSLRRQPARGNPYGRFPEGTIVGILGCYSEMEEVDFLQLTDGLGLRILNEGLIVAYNGFPPRLTDEWDRTWILLSAPTEYRPWAIYAQDIDYLEAPPIPSSDVILAAKTASGLPEVRPYPATITLDWKKLEVIGTLDRRSFDDQKKVMKNNSAREVAMLLGLPTERIEWEWLHLVAFSLGGHMGNPQVPENLILGTAAANTWMMMVEQFVRRHAAKSTYKSVTVVVSRHCPHPNCGWLASNINYLIQFKRSPGMAPKYVRESFNPLLPIAPDFVLKEMGEQLDSFRGGRAPTPISDSMRKPGSHGRRL